MMMRFELKDHHPLRSEWNSRHSPRVFLQSFMLPKFPMLRLGSPKGDVRSYPPPKFNIAREKLDKLTRNAFRLPTTIFAGGKLLMVQKSWHINWRCNPFSLVPSHPSPGHGRCHGSGFRRLQSLGGRLEGKGSLGQKGGRFFFAEKKGWGKSYIKAVYIQYILEIYIYIVCICLCVYI